MSKKGKQKKKVPAAQAIHYVIDHARIGIEFLRELDKESKEKRENGEDGYIIQRRKRVVADSVATYTTSLIDTRSGAHSLLNSYPEHDLVDEFSNLDVVKKCRMNRHNRSGNQSKNYGFCISTYDILSSDLETWLGDLEVFIGTQKEKTGND